MSIVPPGGRDHRRCPATRVSRGDQRHRPGAVDGSPPPSDGSKPLRCPWWRRPRQVGTSGGASGGLERSARGGLAATSLGHASLSSVTPWSRRPHSGSATPTTTTPTTPAPRLLDRPNRSVIDRELAPGPPPVVEVRIAGGTIDVPTARRVCRRETDTVSPGLGRRPAALAPPLETPKPFELAGVAEHAVGGVDACHAGVLRFTLLRVVVGMPVGMVEAHQFAIGGPDLVLRGPRCHTEHLVRIIHSTPPRQSRRSSAARPPSEGDGRTARSAAR